MDRFQLMVALEAAGVPDRWYSIDVERNESTSLVHEGGLWKVFFSERGERADEVTFSTEDEACDLLYRRMMQDIHKR